VSLGYLHVAAGAGSWANSDAKVASVDFTPCRSTLV